MINKQTHGTQTERRRETTATQIDQLAHISVVTHVIMTKRELSNSQYSCTMSKIYGNHVTNTDFTVQLNILIVSTLNNLLNTDASTS